MRIGSMIKQLLDDGTFSGYASVFGVEDQGSDIVLAGAFTQSLATMAANKQVLPMLWNHNPAEPIGVYTSLREDSHGLFCEGKFALGVQRADEAYKLTKLGAVSGLSIGYITKQYEIDTTLHVRKLKELQLMEISLVTFPMNESSRIDAVKSGVIETELDPRVLERLLKDAGLTKVDAVKAVGVVKKYLHCDGADETKKAERDASLVGVLESLREMRKVFN